MTPHLLFFAPVVALLAPGAVTDAPVTPRDATGQPVTPRDATGQPVIVTDDTGQIAPPVEDESAARADSFLRNGKGMLLDMNERERLRDGLLGGHDWRAQIALVEGYNSNVIQTQAVTSGPAVRHPSPFTGIDASAEWLSWTSVHDQQSLRVQVRAQHYTPLDGYHQPDDGSVNGGWNGQFTLDERTYVQGRALATISTVNSARLSDGPLFQIVPSTVQRAYTIETARLALVHELSPRWRWITGADVEISTTLRDTPIQLSASQTVAHRGLDYVVPGIDTGLFHDFGPADIGSLTLRYSPTYIAFLVNFDRTPPVYNGYTTVEAGEIALAWVHAFDERFRSAATLGAVATSAPPLDPDTRPIESPVVSEELSYIGNYWLVTGALTYSYGSANPRLGFGPSAGASLTAQGVPFPHGAWRNFSMVVVGLANRSVFEAGPGALSRLSFVEGSAELRYGVNDWLGVVAGYDGRYAAFEGADLFPSLLRHVVFVGVSGYFASDRSLPTLDTFTSPIKPPG